MEAFPAIITVGARDYAKLAGLTAEEDLEETTFQSMKKRLPWLIILLRGLLMVVESSEKVKNIVSEVFKGYAQQFSGGCGVSFTGTAPAQTA